LENISALKIATHENKTTLKYKYIKLRTLFQIKKQNKKANLINYNNPLPPNKIKIGLTHVKHFLYSHIARLNIF
jgi:hypothetical protein